MDDTGRQGDAHPSVTSCGGGDEMGQRLRQAVAEQAAREAGVRPMSKARRILPALNRRKDAVPLISRSAAESRSAASRADGER
ncbi:hypothetical protein ABZ370_00550 [Streptomyces sp. NPDC005962]|uniref:hypothetical protein n=1 Tax=Streptomyces sp. NPDC005962 TaxID=3154466 RepID=UPI0033D04B2E